MKYLDCYLRVSTSEQVKKGSSLTVQKNTGEKVSKKLGMKCRIHDEGSKSSTSQYRVILNDIKQGIEQGKIKNIWVIERERLFRDNTESILFRRDYLIPYKVKLYVGNGDEVKFNSVEDELTYDLLGRLSQFENDKRKERSVRGKLFKLTNTSKNIPVYLGGTPTFGYSNKNKQWVINKEESKWVKMMFTEYSKGTSSRDIKNILDKNGVKPRRSKTWNIGTIVDMLKNKSFMGTKTVKDKFSNKENPQIYTYKIPSIVSTELFVKVQNKIEENLRIDNPNKKNISLLDGLMVCECGENIGFTRKRVVRGNNILKSELYYCVSTQRKWKTGEKTKCTNQKSLNMERTNDEILRRVMEVYQNSNLIKEKFKNSVMKQKDRKPEDYKQEKKNLEIKIKKLQQDSDDTSTNIGDVRTELLQGRIQKKVGERIIKNLNTELDKITDDINSCMNDLNTIDVDKNWLDWLKRFGENVKVQMSNEKTQREFIIGLIDKIVVGDIQGLNRDNKKVQIGHRFNIHFKMKIVDDKLVYLDDKRKSKGYNLSEGRNRMKVQITNKSSSMKSVVSGKKK